MVFWIIPLNKQFVIVHIQIQHGIWVVIDDAIGYMNIDQLWYVMLDLRIRVGKSIRN